jgi:hypothetical protein
MKPLVFAVALVLPVSVEAQTAATAATPPAVTIPVGTRVGEIPTGYNDGGRRDPFAALIRPKRTGPLAADGRPRTGLATLPLADVTVKGIVKVGSQMQAILEAPGKQSFMARVKDRIMDAWVHSIDATGVVFAEDVGTGTPPQVRKGLRPTGEEVR